MRGCWGALLVVLGGWAAAQDGWNVVQPKDLGAGLENPGMGWVFHHYDNGVTGYGPPLGPAYAGEDFPGLSVAYLRLAWAHIEPEEGRFDWAIVDTPAQRYIAKGKKIAFRFTCSESGGVVYATPEWVRKAGAKGVWWVQGRGVVDDPNAPGALWEPNFGDPVFLDKLDRFLEAAATRYDGNPDVAFIDVGSFGLWGEGHTGGSRVPYSTDVVCKHIDLYAKHFKRTLLAAMDDWPSGVADDLHKQGTHETRFNLSAPKEYWGGTLELKAGLWLPGSSQNGDGRFTPVTGQTDRRVTLGTLDIAQDGAISFRPAPKTGGRKRGDFDVDVGAIERRGQGSSLPVTWHVRHRLTEGATPFCHAVADDAIAFQAWPEPGVNVPVEYARSLGMTLRDDSILWQPAERPFLSDWLAEDFWRDRPIIIESGHYGTSRDSGAWGDGRGYLEAVEAYHASYVSIHWFPKEFLDENRALIAHMNRRIGYRLQIVEASWPARVPLSQGNLPFKALWCNVGVAPCYPGGFPAITLKDAKGNLAAVFADEAFNVRDLPVGPPGQAETREEFALFSLPETLAPGRYDVYASVGSRIGTPEIALPFAGNDGTRRYYLGRVEMAAREGR